MERPSDDQRSRLPLDTEATVEYLAAFNSDIESPATIPVTLTVDDDDHIVVDAADGAAEPLHLDVRVSSGQVDLYVITGVDDEQPYSRLGFVQDAPTLKVEWSHAGEHVQTITCEPLYDLVTAAVAAERDAVAARKTSTTNVRADTGVHIPDWQLTISEETVTFGRGPSHTAKTVLAVQLDDDVTADDWAEWHGALSRAGPRELCKQDVLQPPARGAYDVGGTLTLPEYIDEWYCLDARAVVEQVRLARLSPTDLEPGEFVRVVTETDDEPRDYVVGAIDTPESEYLDPSAKLYRDGQYWDTLKPINGVLRVGRMNSFAHLSRIERLGYDADVDQELRNQQARVLEAVEHDELSDEYDLEVVSSRDWQRGRDPHGRLVIESPELDGPVPVGCRNVFDAGWVASIEDAKCDLTEKEEAMLKQFARENSPIPTKIRM